MLFILCPNYNPYFSCASFYKTNIKTFMIYSIKEYKSQSVLFILNIGQYLFCC